MRAVGDCVGAFGFANSAATGLIGPAEVGKVCTIVDGEGDGVRVHLEEARALAATA